MVAFGSSESAVVWSYERLSTQAARFAGNLNLRGLGSGDRVGVSSEASPEALAAVLGVIAAGASIVPIDVQLRGRALARAVELTDLRLILAAAGRAAELKESLGDERVVSLDADDLWAAPPGDGGRDGVGERGSADSEAAVFLTSGTTGTVKAVPLTHANVAHQIDSLTEAELVGADDTMVLPLPIHHVYPFVIGVLLPLTLGMAIVLPASLTGPELIRSLREGRVTVVVGVPRLYSALLDGIRSNAAARGAPAALWFRSALSVSHFLRWRLGVRAGKLLLAPIHRAVGRSLDVVASGGAALSPETARDLEAFGWRVAVGYGLTETSPILTLDPPGRPRIGSVGRPIAGVELRLDDADVSREGKPGASDRLSEVLARGPNVFAGYLGDEEATRRAFTDDGWFRTGDLGRVDDDGYLYLQGRKSSLIVTESGENVWPEAVEKAYQEEGAIAEIGVFEKDGRLSAVVVPSSGAAEGGRSAESGVRRAVDAASRRLPSHQRIGGYVVSGHGLERTRLGKVRRHLLPLRYEEESDGAPGRGPMDIGEMSEQDRRLLDDTGAAQVWSWFLEKYPDSPLTPDTSPRYDLGIDSLGWLSLTMSVSRSTGVVLDEGTIVRAATIRDLLHEVVSAGRARPGDVRLDDASVETLLRDPERFLDEAQKRALRPHSALEAFLARAINGLVRALSRWLHDLEVEGLENVPLEAPYLIAPNHVSYLDPFVLAAGLGADRLRDVYWSGWVQAAFSNSIKRGVSRLGKTIPLDPHRAAVSSLALGAAVLKRGHALVWFPEGTRSASGRIERFKPGIGMLLDAHRVPVVPVMIHGAHEAWPVGAPRPRFLPIRVVFGRPLDPDELESRGDGRTPAERISHALREEMLRMAEESE